MAAADMGPLHEIRSAAEWWLSEAEGRPSWKEGASIGELADIAPVVLALVEIAEATEVYLADLDNTGMADLSRLESASRSISGKQ